MNIYSLTFSFEALKYNSKKKHRDWLRLKGFMAPFKMIEGLKMEKQSSWSMKKMRIEYNIAVYE